MVQASLITPCGAITVKRNGRNIPFEVCYNDYNTYWINGDNGESIAVHPDTCIKIVIDLFEMKVGDNIICSLDTNIVSSDGGGENMLNAVGEYNGNNIGIGVVDTEDLEYGWKDIVDNLDNDFNKTKRYLPYDTCHCNGGFEFNILDNPKGYRDIPLRKAIILTVVWCSSDKYYSSDIVSFLTC